MNKENLIEYFHSNSFKYGEILEWKEAYITWTLPLDNQVLEIKNLIWYLLESSSYGMIEAEIDDAIESYKSQKLAEKYADHENQDLLEKNKRLEDLNREIEMIYSKFQENSVLQNKLRLFIDGVEEEWIYLADNDWEVDYFYDDFSSMSIDKKEDLVDIILSIGVKNIHISLWSEDDFSDFFLKDMKEDDHISDKDYKIIEKFMFPENPGYAMLKITLAEGFSTYIEPCNEAEDFMRLKLFILEESENIQNVKIVENISIETGAFLNYFHRLQLEQKHFDVIEAFVENQDSHDLHISCNNEYIQISSIDSFFRTIVDIQLFFHLHSKKDISIYVTQK